MVESLNACGVALQQLSHATDPRSTHTALGKVADRSRQFLQKHDGRFERMLDTLQTLPIPRVDSEQVRRWFGEVKEFPNIDLLVQIISEGAPVAVAGKGDLRAATEYGNHNSVRRFSPEILVKIREDVLMGRAFVFPREAVTEIAGTRVSPMTVAVSPSKVRICHDLSNAVSGRGVNEDTDTSAVPECKIGHVLRDVIWRILYLYGAAVVNAAGTPPRILLAKMDTKSAFRQVSVEAKKSPTFSYVFGDFVIIDRCLQFGWTSSPSLWGVCAAAVEHAHNNTTFTNAVVTPEGRKATSHVQVVPPRENKVRGKLPPDYVFPPGFGGTLRHKFWVRTYVDDALFVELESFLKGRRCLRATRSFASDSFRLFGCRNTGEPPLFAREKTTSWDTSMDMLGWTIDTISMTISVTQEKVAQLRALVAEWPTDRRVATVKEVRSLLGKLLHLCEVVRPGKFFVRRILNQLGLAPLKAGEGLGNGVNVGGKHRRGRVRLSREFHDDLAFWKIVVEMATGPNGTTRLEAPLFCCFSQPPSRILISDASGDGMGGFCLESGRWWRIDFMKDIRARLRKRVCSRDDLSVNVCELLGMVVTAWALTVHAGARPEYPGQSILMRGDNMSAVHWVNKCRGAREPRSGALMRMLGCLEMRNEWRFRAKHSKGVANTLADGISRWKHDEIALNLHSYRPDIRWQEQHLGQEALDLTSAVLASSSSEDQLRNRLNAITRRVSGLGASFVG